MSDWPGLVQSRRQRYSLIREGVTNDERGNRHIGVEINNPLSQDEDSPWNTYFANQELRQEIMRVRSNVSSARCLRLKLLTNAGCCEDEPVPDREG